MAMDPDEFYRHALAATDTEQRLPLARMTEWDISPFEQDGLRVSPLRPPIVPEQPRQDEDAATCGTCSRSDQGIWFNEHWRLNRGRERGVPLVLGDGGAHLHTWLFARPLGQSQLLGSWLVVWDDLLPEYPDDRAAADAAVVADALVDSYGGGRTP